MNALMPMSSSLSLPVGGIALAAFVLVSLSAGPIAAQEFELNRLHPTSSVRQGYVTVDDGRATLDGGYELSLWLHYADDPLVFTLGEDVHQPVVAHQLMAHVVTAVSIADRLRLSLDIPVYLSQSSELDPFGTGASELEGGGLGDIRLAPKLSLLDGRADGGGGIALAFGVPISLPTGNDERLQGGPVRGTPTVYFDWRKAAGHSLGVGVNLGVTLTEAGGFANLGVNETLVYGAAVSIPIADSIDLIGEINGGMPMSDGLDSEEIQLESIVLARIYANDLVFGAGGGLGLLEGYGTPDFRAILNVTFAPTAEEPPAPPAPPVPVVVVEEPEPSDRDGDGYLDDEDGCPDDPEDFDGWDDEDGCPEDDNDDDDVLDATDECPGQDGDALVDVQEVHNGYLDEDGCPDLLAELTEDRIQIHGIIYFDLDSDVIQQRSMPVIEDVATVMAEHVEVTLVEVGGHTDNRASSRYNLDLSQRRTESVVRALIERGIDEARLVPRGYGETQLVDAGETEAAHQNNRRVEFLIIEHPEGE